MRMIAFAGLWGEARDPVAFQCFFNLSDQLEAKKEGRLLGSLCNSFVPLSFFGGPGKGESVS